MDKKYRIALVGDSLSDGGAEKVHALLSSYFFDLGYDVQNCIFLDKISYKYKGQLFNIGEINSNSNFVFRKISRFMAFRKFIKQIEFDVVIDFRMRTNFLQEFLISKFIYPVNAIYTVHSGILDYYFPKKSFFSKLIYNGKNVVAVSNAIRNEILKRNLAKNVTCIYNPIDISLIENQIDEYDVEESNYILGAGRMNDDVKQFDKLIEVYSKSILPEKNIKLLLLGDGPKLDDFKQIVENLGLKEMVLFKGFVENPFPYFQKAFFTVVSSKNEGFPNVIIESLASNTPVVSFDCFSGPNEIIVDRFNGLLVQNQDFYELTEALNRFVLDRKLYQSCKLHSSESVLQFDIKRIGKLWVDFLKINVC